MASLHIISLASCIIFASSLALSSIAQAKHVTVPALFVFGDSIVDTGNNNELFTFARADFPPYGENFVNHAPTGRFTDGQLSVDYIASYLQLPFVPPYLLSGDNILQGVSFASGGSGILDSTGEQFGQHISLSQQVAYFKELKETLISILGFREASPLISKSMYIITTGSNDYLSNYHLLWAGRPPFQREYSASRALRDKLLSTFTRQVVDLYNLGARKVAIASIPALGCAPSVLFRSGSKNGDCVSFLNKAVREYNAALFERLKDLRMQFSEAHFVYSNTFDLSLDFVENPTSYGFEFGNRACCGSGRYNGAIPCLRSITPVCDNASHYVFWDYVHPTSAAYRIFAQRLWAGSQHDVYPFNLSKLAQL